MLTFTDGHGRQALVGGFSPQDCDDHLARRLTRDGAPLIGNDIRRIVTDRSHGLPLYLDLSVMRFLEIRRTRTPQPADFDHDFPALIARTLSDLTADERHVLRSVALLDAFDLSLATAAAGLPHEAPALRLVERPFVRENAFGLWPYHLHGLIRSTVRDADDQADDRWSERDWEQAARRALAALGEQFAARAGRDRMLLAGCLRQGLALACDFRLDLGWLTDAAWAYVGDSVWEPITPPARSNTPGDMETAADALVKLLSALARRQHEHREHTADRLSAVAGLLPPELHEMAVYYLAKAQRDLGRTESSRRGMRLVADGGGRLAPAARRGLAHLARLAGAFPHRPGRRRNARPAGPPAPCPGRCAAGPGRHDPRDSSVRNRPHRSRTPRHRGRTRHRPGPGAPSSSPSPTPAGPTTNSTSPQQLLTGLDLRATTLTTRTAALVRDAGTNLDVEDRARLPRTDIDVAGLTSADTALDLALCFHHAVQDNRPTLATTIARLRERTHTGDYAYYADITHYMAGLPLPAPSPTQ